MFRYLRIAILLTILAVVAGNQVLTLSRFGSWDKPLWVTIYPILAEPGDDIRRYADSLKPESFQQIGEFIGEQAARNRIIIAHELMHILGASDKYDSGTGQPIPPDGLANPSKSPLYPQQQAEIMGGRIATSSDRWRRPARLKSCVIGAKTAAEIGWG